VQLKIAFTIHRLEGKAANFLMALRSALQCLVIYLLYDKKNQADWLRRATALKP
jgi:hypothetical protein